jgi:Uma2 family endonuclease
MSAQTISRFETPQEDTGVRLRLLRVSDYHRLADAGIFGSAKVELINGIVIRKHTGEPWLWSRKSYHDAAELGLFAPTERLELIAGKAYLKLPQTALHTQGLRATAETLTIAFGPGFDVRQQSPLVLALDGEPEPDVTVVPGTWRDYPSQPTQEQALLVVEISDTTLRFDRREKAILYAQAGIRDYWIVNLQNRTLEVYRNPMHAPGNIPEYTYQTVVDYQETDDIAPLAAPQASVRLVDLLPPLPGE